MEIPFYLSFDDFQNNYKTDFINLSEIENINYLEYLENLKNKYTHSLEKVNYALDDLRILSKKIFENQNAKLERFYNENSTVQTCKDETPLFEQIQEYRELYKIPINDIGSNTKNCEHFLTNNIEDFNKILRLVKFEIANNKFEVSKTNKEKRLSAPEIIAILNEFGIFSEFKKRNFNRADAISVLYQIIGTNKKNLGSYYDEIRRENGMVTIEKEHINTAKNFLNSKGL